MILQAPKKHFSSYVVIDSNVEISATSKTRILFKATTFVLMSEKTKLSTPNVEFKYVFEEGK